MGDGAEGEVDLWREEVQRAVDAGRHAGQDHAHVP